MDAKLNIQPTPAFLEHYPELGGPPHRIAVEPLPFRLGRSLTANYIIYSRQVSKEHTEIFRVGKEFRIRDLGSTNGTFVNGQRIGEAPLLDGDIIHVAHKELRFGYEPLEPPSDPDISITEKALSRVPASLIRGCQHLGEMITENWGRAVFQPIVDLATGVGMGYEVLGRGTHPDLSPHPAELFHLAEQCNMAAELSRMFRRTAMLAVPRLPGNSHVFFNLHPAEMGNRNLMDSLRELKGSMRPGQQVVLEIHEEMVADLKSLRWLRGQLKDLGMGLAYDDFGAGQSRLTELAEVPPDYIKLDMRLIRGIDTAEARRELVQALTRVTRDLGILTIAEGIETLQEAKVCLNLGCHFAQGFLYGHPLPQAQEASSSPSPRIALPG